MYELWWDQFALFVLECMPREIQSRNVRSHSGSNEPALECSYFYGFTQADGLRITMKSLVPTQDLSVSCNFITQRPETLQNQVTRAAMGSEGVQSLHHQMVQTTLLSLIMGITSPVPMDGRHPSPLSHRNGTSCSIGLDFQDNKKPNTSPAGDADSITSTETFSGSRNVQQRRKALWGGEGIKGLQKADKARDGYKARVNLTFLIMALFTELDSHP